MDKKERVALAKKTNKEFFKNEKTNTPEFFNSFLFEFGDADPYVNTTSTGREWNFFPGEHPYTEETEYRGLTAVFDTVGLFKMLVEDRHEGFRFTTWDLSRFVSQLIKTNTEDHYVFFRNWLDMYVNWEGYSIWNSLFDHFYNLTKDTRKANEVADKTLKEFLDLFR